MSATLARPQATGLPSPMGAAPVAAYVALCLVWGSTFLAIRIAIETIPPWSLIGARSIIAGAILTAIALLRGAAWPGARNLASACVTGSLFFAVSQALLSWGELRMSSGEAAVLVCTGSLLTPLASWLGGASARPGRMAAIGLILGFAGVVVLVRPEAGAVHRAGHDAAVLALLGSSVSWAVGATIARRVKPARSALLGSGLQLLAGGIVALTFAGARGEWTHLDLALISGRSLAGMAYLIVMGSLVAYACFGWLVHIWRPEILSTYGFVNPLVALALGAALANESVGPRELVATAIILLSVAVVMLGNRERSGFRK